MIIFHRRDAKAQRIVVNSQLATDNSQLITVSTSRGFTLLEVMMAMMLAAALAAALAGAFSVGLRAWQRIQQRSDAYQEESAILERMASDLRAACLRAGEDSAGFQLAPPVGKDKSNASLSFTTLLSDREKGHLPYLADIAYTFDPAAGTLNRKVAVVGAAEGDEEEETVAEDIQHFTLRVWDGENWQEQWPAPQNSTETTQLTTAQDDTQIASAQPTLPLSVEISLQFTGAGEKRTPVRVVVPLEMGQP